MNACNCLITGVGGQGTVLLSRLIGAAAAARGLPVRGTETIGMAQRGGSVVSHVRIGTNLHSPLLPPGSAELILGFEPGEAVRALPFLKQNGTLIVLDRAVKPVTSSLRDDGYTAEAMCWYLKDTVKNVIIVDSGAFTNQKVGNVVLLGVALAHNLLPFTPKDVRAVLRERLPERFWALNEQALQVGLAFS
ncbi:MAG: indolepyruvate oxidoreductase subunit beta [Oscillospiraceae bacterium]|jgi:indolepyruvate ferredoxin oxidoreductase beta subunit|nr:indolepyruvate oxidoreductase subunit beta [Oscillospiraceae bacterium]